MSLVKREFPLALSVWLFPVPRDVVSLFLGVLAGQERCVVAHLTPGVQVFRVFS